MSADLERARQLAAELVVSAPEVSQLINQLLHDINNKLTVIEGLRHLVRITEAQLNRLRGEVVNAMRDSGSIEPAPLFDRRPADRLVSLARRPRRKDQP